jgi:hypothetical protein
MFQHVWLVGVYKSLFEVGLKCNVVGYYRVAVCDVKREKIMVNIYSEKDKRE